MAEHVLDKPETHIGKGYKNPKGVTECVEFIKQTLHAPITSLWHEGKKIVPGDTTIKPGTAIATFVNGRYPQSGSTGKHAAIYLGQTKEGIIVVDQWAKQKMVRRRVIKFKPSRKGLSNDGNAYSVVDW